MPIQSFNPTASPNGPVGTASVPNAQPGGTEWPGLIGTTSNARPSGVVETAGTENLRANGTVKNAAPNSTPSGSGKTPAGVQSYNDSSV